MEDKNTKFHFVILVSIHVTCNLYKLIQAFKYL